MTCEFDLLARWRARFPLIGDDAAVVDGLLLAADAVVGGVHFGHDWPAFEVGWKAVTVNASDIAAMGGRPRHLLVTVAAPPGTDLDGLVDGVAGAAEACGCEVAGGDLSATDGPLVVSVAITGAMDAGVTPVLRSGARPGDEIYVTGPLGHGAASGYRERPVARLAEGAAAAAAGATAMIDVSDGLSADLAHLADASGVGFALEDVPVATGATLDDALGGGEDYELVVTGAAVGIPIGRCTDDPSVRTLRGAPLPAGGWEHRWA